MSMNYESCTLCPRMCGADRTKAPGFCGASHQIKAARRPPPVGGAVISGTAGSGTVFFSGCTLKCVFCQNYPLSHENFGKKFPQSGSQRSSWSSRKRAPTTSTW